jgi:RNA polymerase sigma-70 factor, ECF subfamily
VLVAVLTPPRGVPVTRLEERPRRAADLVGPLPSVIPGSLPVASAASTTVLDPPPMSSPSLTAPDVDLVEHARAGERTAFDLLLRRHDDRMRGLAFRLLNDRHGMDDALQDAYLNAYKGLHRFKPGSDFGSWLYRITYNTCIDELRRRKRRPVSAEDPQDPVSGRPGPEREVTAAETVRSALAELPVDQRVTVVLVDGEGFDQKEAAEILGVAPGTVASRLHRARAALRHVIGEVR